MSAQLKTTLEELAPSTVYHMTHIGNLKSIIENGLYSHNNTYQQVDISNQTVNKRRNIKEPIYNKKVHDYVPLYFNPRNAMLYKTQREYRDNIVILGFDSRVLLTQNSLFTNANAAVSDTVFSNDLQQLKEFNWNLIFSSSWNGYGDHVKKAMMAEVLIYQHLKLDKLESINCSSRETANKISRYYQNNPNKLHKNVKISLDTQLFFENLL